ncbi:hypothetical protein MtrunA17_Chr8g0366541 [Medicago truncatula]|uniref:Uncharacterized protein n=1 Tax=Medicago truncatula TaxID=3880 RepID=A0A396GK43_MEDTR|nr:hypothetical protein MtrunA17_Chr8g0366541 [Medicago truncatula]
MVDHRFSSSGTYPSLKLVTAKTAEHLLITVRGTLLDSNFTRRTNTPAPSNG